MQYINGKFVCYVNIGNSWKRTRSNEYTTGVWKGRQVHRQFESPKRDRTWDWV